MAYTGMEKLDPTLGVNNNESSIKSESLMLEMGLTQSELDRIKNNLNNIISAIKANKSWFSMAATFWGPKHWLLKLGIGILIAVAAALIVVMTQAFLLIATVVFILLFYTISSLFLDNHYSLEKAIIEELEVGISALADLLANVINQLDTIRSQLSHEIARFHQENDNLAGNILDFSGQLSNLECKNHTLQKLNDALEITNNTLNEGGNQLKSLVKNYEVSLAVNQEQMQTMKVEYESRIKNLKAQIEELTVIKNDLAKQIDSLQSTCQTLQETNTAILGLQEETKLAQEAHIQKLAGGLSEQNQRIGTQIDTFKDTSDAIKETTIVLKSSVSHAQNLFNQGNKQNAQLQQILAVSSSEENNSSEIAHFQ